ncbi:MAG: CoA transferase [Gammaproteobacteria bacterium]|nr:MAG: CoA transferase [Gammaproteobacteria bacterium]
MPTSSSQAKAALDGITVIDLSRILAGPWASQMLADFGARVIKVERLNTGDDTRHWGPPFIKTAQTKRTNEGEQSPQSAYFHSVNRNKQSIAVDITTVEGQVIIKDLIAKADVLIENYKVGGLKKYGLDYATLKEINPEIIYCSITGFGQTGPYAHKPGYDAMIQGEGGLMSLTGEVDGEPLKVGVAVVDIMTGLYACNAVLAALMSRHETATGQYIDLALLDVQVATLANQGMNYLTTGENPQRLGNQHPNIVPYQCFATSDGSLILAIGNDQQFQRFCVLCELEHLAQDTKYQKNQHRVINRSSLIPVIASKIAAQTTSWWVEKLEQVSVPSGPVNTLDDVFNHPQIKHREMVKNIPTRDKEFVKTIASPINMSSTPLQYKTASPELGQDSKEILADYLGYDENSIESFFDKKVVG